VTAKLEVDTAKIRQTIDVVANDLAHDAAAWVEQNNLLITAAKISDNYDTVAELCATAFLEGGAAAFGRLLKVTTDLEATEGERAPYMPPHKAAATITHNQHLCYLQSVADYAAELYWISEESRADAIARNEVWEIQWYPDSSVGFCRIAASTWSDLVAYLRRTGV
jgi:hypothetical protein